MRRGCRVLPPIILGISTTNCQTVTPTNHLPSLPQPPVHSPAFLQYAAEAAFDLAVPNGMSRAGHSHTGRALCAVVAECCLLLWKSPQTGITTTPTNHLHTADAAFELAVPHGMPRAGHSHTGRALYAADAECCLLLWKSSQTGRTATPTNHLPSCLPQPQVQVPPHLLHAAEAAFDLAVPHGMPRVGHSHTGRALYM